MMPAPGATQHRRQQIPSVWRHADPILAAAVLLIGAFGCLMVYTATRDQLQAAGLSPTYYLQKQALFMVAGVVAMVVVAAIDYRRFVQWAPILYGLSVLMLLAVLGVGHKSRGSQAWFQFGSYQLEPSEFVKVGLIIALAAFVATGKGRLSARALLIGLVLFIIPFALIYKQPDLGSALVLLAVLLAVILIGGVQARQLIALGVVGIVVSVGVVHFGVLKSYQRDRLVSFVNAPDQPDPKLLRSVAGANEYNQAQAKVAIANGGISGRGIGKGSQTNLAYVPEQRTDFIFTAVGEQTGLIGSALLLALFAVVIWRTWRAATLSRDLAGTLICVGVVAMIAFQVFENIGMTMGIMPVAGIPLPLMSYGGSAIIATFAAIGLVQSVRMRRFS
jgi:rod shape determining protein RodA